jgi:cytochrome bd-type quinol oxidase subunit 2
MVGSGFFTLFIAGVSWLLYFRRKRVVPENRLLLWGIVLRGAAFIFRAHADEAGTLSKIWGRAFNTASTITPFFFGTAAAAVASGQVRMQGGVVQTDLLVDWTTPFALTIGALALTLCAVLAVVNLMIEAQNSNDAELVEAFRRRAIIAGAITLVLDAVAFILSPFQAPLLLHGMLDHALPVVIANGLIGLVAGASLERQARRPGVHQRCAHLASSPVCYPLASSLSSSLYKSAKRELEKVTPGIGWEFVCVQLAQQVFYFQGDA